MNFFVFVFYVVVGVLRVLGSIVIRYMWYVGIWFSVFILCSRSFVYWFVILDLCFLFYVVFEDKINVFDLSGKYIND